MDILTVKIIHCLLNFKLSQGETCNSMDLIIKLNKKLFSEFFLPGQVLDARVISQVNKTQFLLPVHRPVREEVQRN